MVIEVDERANLRGLEVRRLWTGDGGHLFRSTVVLQHVADTSHVVARYYGVRGQYCLQLLRPANVYLSQSQAAQSLYPEVLGRTRRGDGAQLRHVGDHGGLAGAVVPRLPGGCHWFGRRLELLWTETLGILKRCGLRRR